jgi:hypothetical protein
VPRGHILKYAIARNRNINNSPRENMIQSRFVRVLRGVGDALLMLGAFVSECIKKPPSGTIHLPSRLWNAFNTETTREYIGEPFRRLTGALSNLTLAFISP